MSHQPERQKKDCLNCGATVAGRYCQVCGQENIENKQSFWGLASHFISDIFHFDGKFFSTLKSLMLKPGYVPAKYIQGKRMSYLDPIRMYLFTSAVFFLFFFAIAGPEQEDPGDDRLMTRDERLELASRLYLQEKQNQQDSTQERQMNYLMDTTYSIQLSKPGASGKLDSSFLVHIGNQDYRMLPKKRNIQALAINNNSGWLMKKLEQNWMNYKRKFGDDSNALLRDAGNTFLHNLPYILFVSLPFFALILKLLYYRRKDLYYSDHAIFTLYHYIFTFLLMLLIFLLGRLQNWLEWKVVTYLILMLFFSGGIYLFVSIRKFYRQAWGRTLWKFFILNISASLVIIFLMFLFIIFSIIQL